MIVTVNENTIDKTAENAQPRENNDETPVNAPPMLPPKTPFHQVALTPFNPSNLSNNIDSFKYLCIYLKVFVLISKGIVISSLTIYFQYISWCISSYLYKFIP